MTKHELANYRQHLLDLGKHFKGNVSELAQEAFRKVGGEPSGSLSNVPAQTPKGSRRKRR